MAQSYFIFVSVLFYVLLSYGSVLALFLSHNLLFICYYFDLLLFSVLLFVVIVCGSVLHLYLFSFSILINPKLGFCIFSIVLPSVVKIVDYVSTSGRFRLY
jgi:hypothetical protein